MKELQRLFPVGITIGIKQPFKKLTYGGCIQLRNDNPQNIVFIKTKVLNYKELEKKGIDH